MCSNSSRRHWQRWPQNNGHVSTTAVTSLSSILWRMKNALPYWKLGNLDSRLPLAQTFEAETHVGAWCFSCVRPDGSSWALSSMLKLKKKISAEINADSPMEKKKKRISRPGCNYILNKHSLMQRQVLFQPPSAEEYPFCPVTDLGITLSLRTLGLLPCGCPTLAGLLPVVSIT